MNRARKAILISAGVVVIGVAFLVASTRPPKLLPELDFLYELGGEPSVGTHWRGSASTSSSKTLWHTGREVVSFNVPQPIEQVNDRIKTELKGNGWKREWVSTGKEVVFSKSLSGNAGLVRLQTVSGGGAWTTVQVLDDRFEAPPWKVWLKNHWPP